MELAKVKKRLEKKGIKIRVTSGTKELLAKKGFDPKLGARPLKRVIQKLILDPLALKLVTGQVKEGDRVLVDVLEGQIVFQTPRDLAKLTKKRTKVTV